MLSKFYVFFIALAIGYMLGQVSVRDKLRKKGLDPSMYEDGNWIDFVMGIFSSSKKIGSQKNGNIKNDFDKN